MFVIYSHMDIRLIVQNLLHLYLTNIILHLRKHSWSRPVRRQNSGIDVENLTPNIVDGTAHIFFSKDKSWFQVV